MIPSTLTLQHERVDDIPLLIGLMKQLHLPEILERALGSHHLHRGISNGWLACGWLAFLLSQSNHRKVSVQDWARSHQHTLEALSGQSAIGLCSRSRACHARMSASTSARLRQAAPCRCPSYGR